MRRGILAGKDELRALRTRVTRRPFDTIYDYLRKRCSLILETQPVSEAQWRSLSQQGSWCAGVSAARTAQGRILDLLIAHHVDRNMAFRDRAIEELKTLISWSAWVDPTHEGLSADLCTAEAAVAATLALDWLWEDLTEADRLRVIQALRHKVIEPYRRAVAQKAWWYTCYHHWNAVVNSGCALAALALGDEEHESAEAYHMAVQGLQHFFDALGREGGWDEGLGYWGYAMRYVLLLAEANARLLDDQSLFHARGMDATGLFPIYFTPNGAPVSFGELPTMPLHGTCYLLVKHYGLKEVTWWLDTYAFRHDVSAPWSAAGLALLFRPTDAETTADPALSAVKAFNEIGWAAMAGRWPRPQLYAAVKTGDLSANHAQCDMNSAQVQVDGEMLLWDPGSAPFTREYFSQARAGFYEVQARAHNTLVVGQREHLIDAQGCIVEAQTGSDYRWVACDAGTACGENVHFVRHAVMLVHPATQVGRVLLFLDELATGVSERVDLYWHTPGQLQLDPAGLCGTIAGPKAALWFALAATTSVTAAGRAHKIDAHRNEQVLHVRTASTGGRCLLLSAFARERIGKIELKESSRGGVRVKAGRATLHFKRLKRHLQLESVETKA